MKIDITNLYKAFGSNVVLNNLDLHLKAGESLVIMGGSGTGKSVLIKCILGLILPDRGSVKVDGKDVTMIPAVKRGDLMHHVGMLFQGGALFDSLTVWENITFYLRHHEQYDKKRAIKKAKVLLDEVGLEGDVAFLMPAELSGGMQKRVALARAIAARPKVMFFDEPTAGLDPVMSRQINALIRETVTRLAATAITITHDLTTAHTVADRVTLLDRGQLVWEGVVKELDTTKNKLVRNFVSGKA